MCIIRNLITCIPLYTVYTIYKVNTMYRASKKVLAEKWDPY